MLACGLLCLQICASAQSASPPLNATSTLPSAAAQLVAPPYTGINMSMSEVKARLIYWGNKYQVPPMILFGIAQQESGWKQYNDDGYTKYHFEPKIGQIGVGIMQITVSPDSADYANLCKDEDHNIEVGVLKLVDKWNNTPDIGDGHYERGREKLENWYYAVWAYNSWGYINNPNNIGNTAYTAQVPQYQNLVYDHIAGVNRPAYLAGLWVDCTLSKPTNAEIGSIKTGATYGCGQKIANTPAPYHVDANFDGVIDGSIDNGSDTDIWVDGSYSGTQTGTQANPYRTVQAAVNRASATQAVVIHIKPGTYSEKIVTSRHIQFVTNGPGTVQIGG